MVVKKTFVLMLMLIFGIYVYAENEKANYQRYDLIQSDLELKVEGSLKYWFEHIADKTLYTLNPGLAVDFGFKKSHSVKADIGYTVSILNYFEAANQFFYAPNDINVSYEYIYKIGHINLFLGPQFTIPLGAANEYSIREGVLNAGSGRYMAGGRVAVTGVRDPVVWNGELSYKVGLPREDRFSTSWLPGIILFSAGISDLLNERFGYSVMLQQNIILPEIKNSISVPDSFSYSGAFRLEVFALFEHDYGRAALIIPVFPNDKPCTVALTYGHVFKKKD